MAAEIWALRLNRPLTEGETAALLALLPPERRARAMRTQPAEKRREPLCAYGLLLRALGARYGWKSLPDMAYGPLGKPFFPGYPTVHFNLSHTAGAVLAGVADGPLGVDIERIRPMREETMRRLSGTSDRGAFFAAWVRREALVKLTGGGVSAGGEQAFPPEAQFTPLESFPGYAAGAAVWSGSGPGAVRTVELDALFD